MASTGRESRARWPRRSLPNGGRRAPRNHRLDASAFLVFLFREKGHERVVAISNQACLSAVNLAEVIGRFVLDGHDADPSSNAWLLLR